MNLKYLLHRIYYIIRKYSAGTKAFMVKTLDVEAKKTQDFWRCGVKRNCKNCEKVYWSHCKGRQQEKHPPFNFYWYGGYVCGITKIYTDCDDDRNLNYQGECSKYKRKWWKFWIK